MHFLRLITILTLVLTMVPAASATDLVKNYGGQNYTFIDYTYQGMPGRLYVPDGYDPNTPTPLVTFLHGLGERGTNNTSQVGPQIANLTIQANARGFLLFTPQSSGWWPEVNQVAEAVGKIGVDYNIDAKRVYVTGLSAGGFGTMNSMRNHANLYAGYVPLSVAGGAHFKSEADAAVGADRPAWYFSGYNEASFRNASRESVRNTLLAQGVAPGDMPVFPTSAPATDFTYISPDGSIRATEIAGGGHNNATWNNGAYASSAMYDWLLSQTSNTTSLQPGHTMRVSLGASGNQQPLGRVDNQGRLWNTPDGYRTQSTAGILQTYARDQNGNHTTVTVELNDPFYATGTTTLPVSSAYGEDEAGSFWRLYEFQKTEAQLTFHGLEAGGLYDLEVFASIDSDDATNYRGLYSVGDESVVINASHNDQAHTFKSLVAGLDGTLVLDVALLTNEGGDIISRHAVLNAVALTAIPEPGVGILLTVFSVMLLPHRRRA